MNEYSAEHESVPQRHDLITELWRLLQLTVGFFTLYSLIANVVNKVALLASGAAGGGAADGMVTAAPVAAPGIVVTLPGPLAEIGIACIVLGVITYFVLKYLCESEWVQEEVEIEECWEEIKWYNPFSWVKAIVCTIVKALQWVLKTICGWVPVLVTGLVIACVIVSVIIALG